MRNIIVLVLIVAACLGFASNGHADVRPGDISFSPFFGGYAFDSDLSLKTGTALGLRLGMDLTTRWAVEGVYDHVSTKGENTSSRFRANGYRLEALYHFMPDHQLVPFLAAGGGGTNLKRPDGSSETDKVIDYGAGIKYSLAEQWGLRADVRHLLVLDGGRDDFEYTIGLIFRFGGTKAAVEVARKVADADGDGVADAADRCPSTTPGAKVDSNGCPVDSDGDGVADYLDKCADTPKGVKVDKDGCPVPAAVVDSDGDGVADSADKCPDSPKGGTVDKNGCPIVVAVDTDGDGVADSADKCLKTPQGVKVDQNGCPIDADGDGVADYLDKCTDTPKGKMVDKDGCITEKVSISLEVAFDSGKSVVKPQYHEPIKKVADFMKAYPETTAVIGGYTDDVGSQESNIRLSQRRADSVRTYLIEKFGIAAGRVTAKGYGPANPIADNKTPEGRARNRRIEAVIEATTKK